MILPRNKPEGRRSDFGINFPEVALFWTILEGVLLLGVVLIGVQRAYSYWVEFTSKVKRI